MNEDKLNELYYRMRQAAADEHISLQKFRRINSLFATDEATRLVALKKFFSSAFFTNWEWTWNAIYTEAKRADIRLQQDCECYSVSGSLIAFYDFEELWNEYYGFKDDEEIRQSVSPPQDADGTTVENKKNAPTCNCPPIETGDALDTPPVNAEGQLDPRLDNFKFGFLCAMLEQHGITQGGKYNYIEGDKAHNWAIAGYLIREVTKRFGIKIQGGGAAWSILCPFWKIRESSARNGSQYDKGGSEEKRNEINDIITEALEKNISD